MINTDNTVTLHAQETHSHTTTPLTQGARMTTCLTTSLFDRLPVDAHVNILSYLTLSNMFDSAVNQKTRMIFTLHIGPFPSIISSAFKEQLEWHNSQGDPLTYNQYQHCKRLGATPSSKDIHYLDLRNSGIDDNGLQTHIQQYPHLITLNLSDCSNTTDTGLLHLQGLHSLERLDLTFSEISDTGLRCVANIPTLRHLNLSQCLRISNAGLAQLQPQLQSLNLRHCYDIDGTGLQQLQRLSQLQELDLTGCYQILDADLQHLQGLPLTQLNLSRCSRLTDTGLPHLAELTALEQLNLNECFYVTNEGLHLAGLTGLKQLDLGDFHQIADEGQPHLAGPEFDNFSET